MWVSDPNIVIFFYIIVFTVLEINELKQDCKVPDSNVYTPFHFYLQTSVCALLMST